jgi:eukaryotic-like serine/threonine-protein kinase
MPEPTVFNGRFELRRRLGKGGMAEVFLARDLQLDRAVAVKVLFPEFATDPSFVARFRREAQAAANLNHPNIVSVYDWGEEHGTYFIVMEYVDGTSLADMVRTSGALTVDQATDVATDVAAALGHAHSAGMLHRDIKPGNILITPTGNVKVADWGIGRAMDAAVEDNLTQTGAVMGTATYFSPEQAQGLPLDNRSDLYALGVVIYEMLTGRPPFSGDSPVAIAYKHVQEPPRPLRSVDLGIPAELEAITMRLLAKAPSERYRSADELRADLQRFRSGLPLSATAAAAAAATVAATTAVPVASQTQVVPTAARYEPPPPEPPPKRSAWLVLLLLVLAGLLFLLARALGIGEDDDTPEVVEVEVPRVVDLPVEQARQILTTAGFAVVETPEEVADAAQVGVVIEQDPESGIRVEQGSEVEILVGTQNLLPMPDLTGSTPDEAVNILRELGFTATPSVTEEDNEEVEAGVIIRTEPPGGQEVAADAPINFIVSSGPPPVPVPNVATLTESDAVDAVEAADLVPQVRQEASGDVNEGRVIRTEPAAGTPVERGSTVVIVVSSGPQTVPVPDVVGLDEESARSALEGAGFRVEVQTESVPIADPSAGTVIEQSPQGNSQAEPGATVTITVAQEDVGD